MSVQSIYMWLMKVITLYEAVWPMPCPCGSELLETQACPCHRKLYSEDHGIFFLPYTGTWKQQISAESFIPTQPYQDVSGKEGRKVPQCSASKNGIKKHSRKGKAAQSPTDPAFLTWAFCSLSSVSQQHILRNYAVRPLKHRVILG